MRISLLRGLVGCGVLCFSALVWAAAPTWQVVPAESKITFTATQNGSPLTGEFKSFTGDIQFDPADLTSSHVKIAVDIASVSTSYKEVADTLKTPDWFDVKLFPQAVFEASHFTKVADNQYQADGSLKIRDKTVPVVLTFSLDKWTPQAALAKGSTTLKRTAFGVGKGDWAKTDAVKDDVKVDFILSAKK